MQAWERCSPLSSRPAWFTYQVPGQRGIRVSLFQEQQQTILSATIEEMVLFSLLNNEFINNLNTSMHLWKIFKMACKWNYLEVASLLFIFIAKETEAELSMHDSSLNLTKTAQLAVSRTDTQRILVARDLSACNRQKHLLCSNFNFTEDKQEWDMCGTWKVLFKQRNSHPLVTYMWQPLVTNSEWL